MHAHRASISDNHTVSLLPTPGRIQVQIPVNPPKHTTATILLSKLAKAADGGVTLAPGLAQRILDELNFPGQRKRKPFRVSEHLARIRKGTWNPQYPITVVSLPDGTLWLADGQHRMEAIAQSGVPIDVRVNHMYAEDEHEARRIYAGFDRPEYIRTQQEMLDGLGAVEETGLKRETVRCLFRALPILMNNMEHARSNQEKSAAARSVETRIDLLPFWTPQAVMYESMVAGAERALKQPLYGAGVMAVALYVLRHQPARAQEFWRGVIDAGALTKDDPRQRLMWELLNRALNVGNLRQGIQMTALAWTRWCEGTRMKMIRCTEGAPIVIWGTPLAKGNQA
jgi:hypothetical protein